MYDLFINKDASNIDRRLHGEATKVGAHVARIYQPWLKSKRKAEMRRQNAARGVVAIKSSSKTTEMQQPAQTVNKAPSETIEACIVCGARTVDRGEEGSGCANSQCAGVSYRDHPTQRSQVTSLLRGRESNLNFRINSVPIAMTSNYGTDAQARSLSFYLQKTGPMISMSGPGKKLFTVIIPQASWTLPPVKHMLCALSTLDQFLSGSMTSLSAEDGYGDALKFYNQAIVTFREIRTPSLSELIIFSLMAYCFDVITNDHEKALVHHRIMNVFLDQAKQLDRSCGAELQSLLSQAELISQEGGCMYGQKYSKQIQQNRHFSNLDECRSSLHQVVKNLAALCLAPTHNFDTARHELCMWRVNFEQYRYVGPEPLQEKRTVFLAHNIVGTYLDLMESVQSEPSQTLYQKCLLVLDDVDHIVEAGGDLEDLRWILLIVLKVVADTVEAAAATDMTSGWNDLLSHCRTLTCKMERSSRTHGTNCPLSRDTYLDVEDQVMQIHQQLRSTREKYKNSKSITTTSPAAGQSQAEMLCEHILVKTIDL